MRDPDAERVAPLAAAQVHYSIRTDEHYFAARDSSTLEIVTNDRQRSTRAMKLTNAFFYTEFTHDRCAGCATAGRRSRTSGTTPPPSR